MKNRAKFDNLIFKNPEFEQNKENSRQILKFVLQIESVQSLQCSDCTDSICITNFKICLEFSLFCSNSGF